MTDARLFLLAPRPRILDGVNLSLDLPLDSDSLRLRALTIHDAPLVVEATSAESRRALWGARPSGPYSLTEAQQALAEWDLVRNRQISYGIVGFDRLLGAVGLMLDSDQSAELAYWVRPESRRRGLALMAVIGLTNWAHENAGLSRLWLEINPDNLASRRLAEKAGYLLEDRLPKHCRSWLSEDPERDDWHDCLVWAHRAGSSGPDAAVHLD